MPAAMITRSGSVARSGSAARSGSVARPGRLPLLLACVTLLHVAASKNDKCVVKFKGVLVGETEKLTFELHANENTFVTSLPRRIGVVINGVKVKACGVNEPTITLDGYWVVVERGPGSARPPVELTVTRYYMPAPPAEPSSPAPHLAGYVTAQAPLLAGSVPAQAAPLLAGR